PIWAAHAGASGSGTPGRRRSTPIATSTLWGQAAPWPTRARAGGQLRRVPLCPGQAGGTVVRPTCLAARHASRAPLGDTAHTAALPTVPGLPRFLDALSNQTGPPR